MTTLADAQIGRVMLATAAMGTRFEFVLAGDDERTLRAAGEEALSEVVTWHERLSRFVPHSDVARLRRDGSCRVHPETRTLLELCESLREQTGGAFDVRVGAAMEQLGFYPAGERSARGVALDFGAIGKGFALDRAAEILRGCGIRSALLHGGTSSVVGIGAPPEHPAGWEIAIGSAGRPLRIRLRDRALGVSSPRGRAVPAPAGASVDGAEYTHILDPRTGAPASTVGCAAVVGESAAICDGWSTALVVLGRSPETLPSGYESHLHTPGQGWVSDTRACEPP